MERKTLDYFRDLVDSMAEEDLIVLLKELAANLMYQDYVEKQEEPMLKKEKIWESIMTGACIPDDMSACYIQEMIFYCADCEEVDLKNAYLHVSERYGVSAKEIEKEITETLVKAYRVCHKRMSSRDVTNFEDMHFGHQGVIWSKPEVFILEIAKRMKVWV